MNKDVVLQSTINNLYMYSTNEVASWNKALKDDGLEFNKLFNYLNECFEKIVLPLDKLRAKESFTIKDLEEANNLLYELSAIQVKYSDMLDELKENDDYLF